MSNPQSYLGLCSLCGSKGEFVAGTGRSVRESYPCPHCRASLRYRDQAALILDEFGCGRSISIPNLVASGRLSAVSIYEPALHGPFINLFKKLPYYRRSYFWPDRAPGTTDENGVQCEDMTKLTYSDDSFDLVITSDVMEHVYEFKAAFTEVLRVLKPGGVHIFSIPNAWPFPDKTEQRVSIVDGVEHHIKPARYHTSGDGTPCIVYTDFGADLIEMIDTGRSRTQAVRRHSGIDPCYVNATFMTRKLA